MEGYDVLIVGQIESSYANGNSSLGRLILVMNRGGRFGNWFFFSSSFTMCSVSYYFHGRCMIIDV